MHVCPAVRLCEPRSHSRSQPKSSFGRSQTAVAPHGPPALGGAAPRYGNFYFCFIKTKQEGKAGPARDHAGPVSHLDPNKMRKPFPIWALTEPSADARVPSLQQPAARTQGGLELQGPGQKQVIKSKASAWQNENHFLHQESGLLCECS